MGTQNLNVMNDMTVSEEEVIHLCKEINPTKSSAIHNITVKILRFAFITLSKQITRKVSVRFMHDNLIFQTDIEQK